MLQTLKNAWNTKELRVKILFTLFILLLYRIGTVIPVPFVEANKFSGTLFSGTILEQMDILSGGSLGTFTVFALGVSPYINASIIIQLLAVVFPRLGELAKNDKEKMNFITRIVTVVLAIVTAIGYYFLIRNNGLLVNAADPAQNPGLSWLYGIVIIACYCAGAAVIMWLGELINKKGIGNGISMILFANIVSTLPSFVYQLVSLAIRTYSYTEKAWLYGIVSTAFALAVILVLVALFIFVIWVTGSERRIPITYAKRVIGRKMYGGQSQNLPIKLNMTGVMPIIFASSIVSIIPTVITLCGVTETNDGFWAGALRVLGADGVVYPVCLFLLIIVFAYFYTQITFDPVEVSNNIKKQGGAIPGIRQGRPTADYIRKILNKVTLVGAIFLGIVAVLPVVSGPHIFQHIIEWIFRGDSLVFGEYIIMDNTITTIPQAASSITSHLTFGGTSILIIVGVVIETFRGLESELTMRNYKGFL